MKNNTVSETLVELIGSNIKNDEIQAKAVALIRAEYGVKDGSRIASKHLLHVEEQVARAIVDSGKYPGVTTRRHGEGWAISHPDGRSAAEAAKKMKQRVLGQLISPAEKASTAKQTAFDRLLSTLVAWTKRASKMKLTEKQKDKVRAALENALAELG